MRWLNQLMMQARMLLFRTMADTRLNEELRFHVEQQIAENRAAGMSEEEARIAALRIFGNPDLVRLPVLVVVLAGGFTTNFIWCVILNVRNHTGYQYFHSEIRGDIPERNEEHILEAVTDAPAEEMAVAVAVKREMPARAPMLPNYLFSALAGTTWYMQFFFYTMGETQMGRFKFSSWTLHMASIIIFSTLWGIALKEWKGAGARTMLLVVLSLLILVTSTVIVGYGNYIGGAH
jgi:L-rhamnose-H+ transport protein